MQATTRAPLRKAGGGLVWRSGNLAQQSPLASRQAAPYCYE
jgi:hypothetical protein